MTTNDPTLQGSAARTFLRSPLGAVTFVLMLEGILFALWSMGRPAPPRTILLDEHLELKLALENQLDKEKTETREAKQQAQSQLKLKEARYANLQKKHDELKKELAEAIHVERLPKALRADTAARTLTNIETLCQEHAQVNPVHVAALLGVMVEIQRNGTIDTTLEAQKPTRQSLYKQIQVLLQCVGAYSGAISGTQAKTLEAVKAFQTANKLKVDGKIGLKTYMVLAGQFAQDRLAPDKGEYRLVSEPPQTDGSLSAAPTAGQDRGRGQPAL